MSSLLRNLLEALRAPARFFAPIAPGDAVGLTIYFIAFLLFVAAALRAA